MAKGITINARRTVKAPDGSKVVSYGVQVVPDGLLLGVVIEDKDHKKTEFGATIDAESFGALLRYGVTYLLTRRATGFKE